jgi:ketosteroid isomerase-like protein
MDCVVTVRKVEEVTRDDFDEFLRDSVTGSNILQRDDTAGGGDTAACFTNCSCRGTKKGGRADEKVAAIFSKEIERPSTRPVREVHLPA